MVCSHSSCSPDRRVWLPLLTHMGINLQLKKHPYCEECGIVKNLQGDKAKSIGYYTNALVDMKEHIERRHKRIPKLTQTQVRLIARELESNDLFNDKYGSNLDVQVNKYVEEVQKYRPDLSEDFIKGFL